MRRPSAIRQAVAVLGLVSLAGFAVAQVQPPVPPVPGPYALAPVPMFPMDEPGSAAPAAVQRPGPPPSMSLPYWMRPPAGQGGGATGAPAAGGETAAPSAAPTFPPRAPAPGRGYGRTTAPGYFPGYGGAQGPGGAAPQMAQPQAAPQGYQPYVPQAYGSPPGWGWGAPQGWAQPQPWGAGQ